MVCYLYKGLILFLRVHISSVCLMSLKVSIFILFWNYPPSKQTKITQKSTFNRNYLVFLILKTIIFFTLTKSKKHRHFKEFSNPQCLWSSPTGRQWGEVCVCTKGTNDPQNCVYRVAYLSFKISINFTLLKYLKVDERNKILNFFEWFFGTLSIQEADKRVCALRLRLERGEMAKAISFHSIVVGMGSLKQDPGISRPQLYLLSHFCTWNKMLLLKLLT